MKTIEINLYSFAELNKEAQEKAIAQHAMFLESQPVECENEAGQMIDEYLEYSTKEVIESIEANEYLFFSDGVLAHCTTYTGKHPRSGQTEFHFHGKNFIV